MGIAPKGLDFLKWWSLLVQRLKGSTTFQPSMPTQLPGPFLRMVPKHPYGSWHRARNNFKEFRNKFEFSIEAPKYNNAKTKLF